MQTDTLRFGELMPNAEYADNGLLYRTDTNGRITLVQGFLHQGLGEHGFEQTRVGKLGLPTDEGGHIIARRFGGSAEGFNLLPMNSNLNRSDWKKMENQWDAALACGKQVEVGIEPLYLDNDLRPWGFEVVYEIDRDLVYKIFFNEREGEDKSWPFRGGTAHQ